MPVAALPVLILGLIGAMLWAQRQRARALAQQEVRDSWGRARPRPRNPDVIAAYANLLAVERPDAPRLDDRTWADLNMDDVFGFFDRTDSSVGQQVLYARLRSGRDTTHLDAFDALSTRMQDDAAAREQARLGLSGLGDAADAADLNVLAAPGGVGVRPWWIVFPMIGLVMLAGIAAAAFWPPAVLLLAGGVTINLALRATVAADLRLSGRAFRQIAPILAAAESLAPLDRPDTAPITGQLARDTAALGPLRRAASWVGRETSASASGEIGALVIEYLNMAFCLDGNALYFGARHLRGHGAALCRVVQAVGEVDAAVSVASYRVSAGAWTRPAFLHDGEPMTLLDIRHPLVPDAVPSSVTLGPPFGVIVTGSNMSGKSTFLRTLGVSAVLAQTIATCAARTYQSPRLFVRSCIGQTDDPATGKSYYLVEVESVLSLVAATRAGSPHLLLFDELFRGTNAVERIAAGEAVLAALVERTPDAPTPRHIVVAATHDQELVDLLAGSYAPFHFADRIDADGLSFDYRLEPGAATTRNAIALLGLRGAPASLVAHAMARAEDLDDRRRRIAASRD